jgi:hypothetical protein
MSDPVDLTEPRWTRNPPSAFDIAASWYPEREAPDKPGPILRPVLITAVLRGESSGLYACRVAFGTKNLKIVQRQADDLIIQNARDLEQFGLGRATRFDLDFTATLPWNKSFFGCWTDHTTPVIGSLTEEYIRDYAFLMMRRQSA